MEDLTGKQLGSYQIVEPLGEGGMAAVYKAYQPGMERYVALKILPRHFASDLEFVGRFEQEAKVLAKLQHPHILPVFDFGEADSYTYIVMPFLKSGDLNDLLRGQPLSLPQIRHLISQLGDALDYAHQRGLIHRDVKPSNVLLDERGNCLLMDFGIAKMVEGSTKFTATGGLIGTPAYMSPEQGLGRKLDGRSDIYALGIMLYEMATGRVPYRAETPMAVVVKHINDPLPPPRQINPDLPEAIERVILKALAKQPEDRYQTAGEMVRALQAAIPDTIVDETLPVDKEATIISTAGPTREARIQEAVETAADRKTSRSGLIWILAAAAVTIVVIGAIASFATRGRQEETDTGAITAAMATVEQAQADATKLLAEEIEAPLTATAVSPADTPKPTDTPLPTQPTPTPTPSIWMDDFDDALDPGWSWLNEDPTHWSLTDAPGSLRIITQGESLYNTGQPSNLLLRDTPQGNFQIVAKVTLNPTDNFQQAAILIYQDEDNFVLLNRGFCDEEGCVGGGVNLDREFNGEVDFGGPRASLSLQTILLGLRKEGTRYIGYYSTDGENWTALGALEHPMTPTKVGLTANNSNSDPNVPQIPVDFDFFAIREL